MTGQATQIDPNSDLPLSGDGLTSDLMREAATLNLSDECQRRVVQLAGEMSIAETSEAAIVELCRIPELHSMLGHQREPRRLVEEMANFHRYPEAILTRGFELYECDSESPDSLGDFLQLHADSAWLLDSLARRGASSSEKEQMLLAAVQLHSESERIFKDYRQTRLELQTIAEEDPQRLQELYATGDPKVWLALARNSHTPETILSQLSEVKAFPLARETRQAAKLNLTNRK